MLALGRSPPLQNIAPGLGRVLAQHEVLKNGRLGRFHQLLVAVPNACLPRKCFFLSGQPLLLLFFTQRSEFALS
jgi:hypothetical protein